MSICCFPDLKFRSDYPQPRKVRRIRFVVTWRICVRYVLLSKKVVLFNVIMLMKDNCAFLHFAKELTRLFKSPQLEGSNEKLQPLECGRSFPCQADRS